MRHSLFAARSFLAAFSTVVAVLGMGVVGPVFGQGQAQVAPMRVAVGQKAPNFSLPSAEGKTVKLSDYAGHIVLIDFYRGYW